MCKGVETGTVSKRHKSTSSSLLHTREVEDTGMALERHLHVCYMRGRWRRSRHLRQVYALVLHGRGSRSTVGTPVQPSVPAGFFNLASGCSTLCRAIQLRVWSFTPWAILNSIGLFDSVLGRRFDLHSPWDLLAPIRGSRGKGWQVPARELGPAWPFAQ